MVNANDPLHWVRITRLHSSLQGIAMKWTKEEPLKRGAYWMRASKGATPQIIEFDPETAFIYSIGNDDWAMAEEGAEWSSTPIPLPQEVE